MKKLALVISSLAIATLVNAAPFVSETESTNEGPAAMGANKDECLLVAMNCPESVDPFQIRIDKLQAEIDKGTAVYSNEELNVLRKKLNDAYERKQLNFEEGY
jgi:hypothetical protein